MEPNFYRDREQTGVKHRFVERYLQAAVRILGSWADDLVYVDCCAGPWNAVGHKLEDTSFGCAIDVLTKAQSDLHLRQRAPSLRALLIEKEHDSFVQLDTFAKAQQGIEVSAKNWDFAEHTSDIVRYVTQKPKSFSFVLIDPTGWEAACLDKIAPLLRLQPGEVMINLMTSWITRFLDDESKPFGRLLGPDVTALRQLDGEEREEAIVRRYCEEVRRVGNFRYVCALPILKAKLDSFHYYLIYATRNARGVEVFKETERDSNRFMHEIRAEAQLHRDFERTNQYPLLQANELYRESKYSRFRQKNLLEAKRRVVSLLQSSRDVGFDDVWAESMQFACVLPEDLNSWLDEWQSLKKLAITPPLRKRERTLKKGVHTLHWCGKVTSSVILSPEKRISV